MPAVKKIVEENVRNAVLQPPFPLGIMNNPLARDFVLYIVVSCAFLVVHDAPSVCHEVGWCFPVQKHDERPYHDDNRKQGPEPMQKVVVGQHEDKKDEAAHR